MKKIIEGFIADDLKKLKKTGSLVINDKQYLEHVKYIPCIIIYELPKK